MHDLLRNLSPPPLAQEDVPATGGLHTSYDIPEQLQGKGFPKKVRKSFPFRSSDIAPSLRRISSPSASWEHHSVTQANPNPRPRRPGGLHHSPRH
ncbi:hypothetical protein CRG98_026837 [Punica granatum]|uniref:Uncharacterized protein n=1 Tax=Punica granatum TaxID=22663 RepID=A0A2I0J933_PUNGR|nr:hypothetical protein CRG98_026837 [Punica granatum]